jgi:predicted RNase H-related nuclease YkuK (DUF458 family)
MVQLWVRVALTLRPRLLSPRIGTLRGMGFACQLKPEAIAACMTLLW